MSEEKKYEEERFEFALYVNNNVICKRNFRINNYIEGSMNTIDFKDKVDEIVELINNDLKSKSRVHIWYHFNPEFPEANKPAMDELMSPTLNPWECTFKFVVSDNNVPIISKIWDGYAYPKSVRERVDLANKTVKTWDGVFDKETYFAANEGKLSPDMNVIRSMIIDKPDLLLLITKKICETCSPRENGYKSIGDYTTVESFGNDWGSRKSGASNKTVKYALNLDSYNKKIDSLWGSVVAKKTKEYFHNFR